MPSINGNTSSRRRHRHRCDVQEYIRRQKRSPSYNYKKGENCVKVYNEKLQNVEWEALHIQPFDAVILDYKMQDMDGIEVAKEILEINPQQRIIFASAYIKETLLDSVKLLKQPVELLAKAIW